MVPENDLKFYDVVEMDIPTNYINITRNAFDIPHFTSVHGWQTVELVDFGYEGGHENYPHCAYIELYLGDNRNDKDGDVNTLPPGKKSLIKTRNFDPFNNRIDVSVDDVHLVTAFNKLTEVDEHQTTLSSEFWVPEGLPLSIGKLYAEDAVKQTAQDIPIWKTIDYKQFTPVSEVEEFYAEWIGRFE